MKNLKKVLAFVIAFTMVLGLSISASIYPDVDDNASYAEAVTILNSLRIMYGDDNGNFRPDDTITRAEVAAVVVRALGLEDASNGAKGATIFTDVADSHWATGYINLATQKAIINGYGDGTFGPENPVTYEQVTKMIVAALGYTPKAEANGGYPTGYLVISAQEGISKGATGTAGEPAKRSVVARLIFNALEVNLMEQTGFKANEPEFEVVNKTLLANYLKVDKYEGVVTSTYLTKGTDKDDESITIEYTVKNGKKEIDDATFDEGKVDAASLLGKTVVAYVAEDEDTNDETIVAIAPKSGKNSSITLDYAQIEKVWFSGDDVTKVEYFAKDTDNSTTKLEIADNYKKFYNGRIGDVEDWLDDPTPGNVTFIDNNSDDEYDYIMVNEYTANYVVDSIDAKAGTVSDKDGRISEIDTTDDDIILCFFFADGTAASFEDIKEGDVLTLVENEPLVKVYISSKTVEGKVTEERTDENGESVYTIDGNEYKLASDDVNVSTNDEGLFYLNIDNRIVMKDTTRNITTDKYAFAYAAAVEDGIGGATAQLKFLTANGEWKTLDFAKKVSVYTGKLDNKGKEIVNTVDSIPSTGTSNLGILKIEKDGTKYVTDLAQTLFQYDTNSSGLINRIYVTNASTINDDAYFSLDYSKDDVVYRASSNRVGSADISDDTVIFSVPARDAGIVDEDDIKIASASSIFTDGDTYCVDVYDNDEYASVIVVFGAEADIDLASQILLVTRVTDITNDEGTKVKKIYGLQSGEAVSGETSEDGVEYQEADGKVIPYYDLEAGDVVIFSLDAAGAIEKVRVLMTREYVEDAIDDNDGAFYVCNDDEDETADVFGFVGEKKSGKIKLFDGLNGDALMNLDDVETSLTLSGANVYEVNLNRSNISNACTVESASAIVAEDRAGKDANWIYVRMYDGKAIDVVVYNFELPSYVK